MEQPRRVLVVFIVTQNLFGTRSVVLTSEDMHASFNVVRVWL